jgi:hypothetical protein
MLVGNYNGAFGQGGGPLPPPTLGATVNTRSYSKVMADLVFRAEGTNTIYTRNPLERHFRAIHVAIRHNARFPIYYKSAGKVLMGLRPSEPGW